jgi:3-hydroxyisobutyrate dehydrogenase-like beta-hydroxyacid dehydrogenase
MKQSMKRLTADQVKVGFIGLGNMGSRIATRLLDRGYQLSVYDMDPAKAEAIAAPGGEATKNILELARTADVLLSCLTNDEAVRSVYTRPEGVFAGARPGTVVLEMSTISPKKEILRCWWVATRNCSAPLSQYSRRSRNNTFF